MPQPAKISLGVSACLLGEEVRYDGGHTYDHFVARILGGTFNLVGVCPEAELGMGIPRETVRLTGSTTAPHMTGSQSAKDWTAPMNRWSGQRIRQLIDEELCGYVFKRNSPSCGVFRVKVYQDQGRVKHQGRGLFAAEFARRLPLVPLEEEVRLQDPATRENFTTRVFALHRLKQAFQSRWRRAAVVNFHARETELLLAHDRKASEKLDTLLATMTATKPAVFKELYMTAFMASLEIHATPAKHARVMRELAANLRPHLAKPEYKALLSRITDYRAGHSPRIAAVTLLQHYGQMFDLDELQFPSYLNPDPREVMLHNHA